MTYRTTSALAGLALLTACAPSSDPVYTAFHREAGALLDTNELGAATKNNVAVMSGERRYTYGLARRFAAEVPTTVNFAFNSSQLGPQARATLQRQAHWIRQFPEVRFRVYGHTDLVGSDAYNKALGQRRAEAAVNYLGQLGVSLSRLEAVVSFGENRPLVFTQSRELRNRRTVTEVSGFVEGHRNVLDGKYARIIYREYVDSAVPATELSAASEGSLLGE